ncbi:hypothetical protein [Desulfuribacillus alkaliarsenatis]|uniref:Uncharacterized protein n=1 Tax=Desulfuribacillus alkaliarsenatis TaxID=766136 RepID=A0A1E5G4R6_9FIRM|nr:hypothetical protein [Desulfuribacillus alkaliarsenatis]OEF98166.1 hypothetical protein BHF68_00300 [Desulfuribacillus alkaliarsenatis]
MWLRGISEILVSFIVDSFQRLGRIEEYVKQIENEELFSYKLSVSKLDVIMVLSLGLLITGLFTLS